MIAMIILLWTFLASFTFGIYIQMVDSIKIGVSLGIGCLLIWPVLLGVFLGRVLYTTST